MAIANTSNIAHQDTEASKLTDDYEVFLSLEASQSSREEVQSYSAIALLDRYFLFDVIHERQ
jgi:hypothetical protein